VADHDKRGRVALPLSFAHLHERSEIASVSIQQIPIAGNHNWLAHPILDNTLRELGQSELVELIPDHPVENVIICWCGAVVVPLPSIDEELDSDVINPPLDILCADVPTPDINLLPVEAADIQSRLLPGRLAFPSQDRRCSRLKVCVVNSLCRFSIHGQVSLWVGDRGITAPSTI